MYETNACRRRTDNGDVISCTWSNDWQESELRYAKGRQCRTSGDADELRVAITKGDMKAYGRLVGDDYVYTNQDAVVRTKAQMVSAYDSGSLKYESAKFDEIKVHAYGDTAVVTGRNTTKGKDNGKDFVGQFRYTRVYVKRQGRWQLVATQATRIPGP